MVVKVVVGDRGFSPAGFTPRRLPLSPLPSQCCLGLSIAETKYNGHQESLKVAEDIYKEVIDGPADAPLRPPGEKDELDSQQRDEDEGGSHRLHVGCGLSAVGVFQLGDQDPDDVQEEKEIHKQCSLNGPMNDIEQVCV